MDSVDVVPGRITPPDSGCPSLFADACLLKAARRDFGSLMELSRRPFPLLELLPCDPSRRGSSTPVPGKEDDVGVL